MRRPSAVGDVDFLKANWQWFVTTAIAAYAVVLTARQIKTDKATKQRLIQVRITNGFHTLTGQLSEWMLFVGAVNPGDRTVTLVGCGLELPDGSSIVIYGTQSEKGMPVELQEGKGNTAWVAMSEVESVLRQGGYKGKVKVRGFYRNALGTTYKSKPWPIDLENKRRPRDPRRGAGG